MITQSWTAPALEPGRDQKMAILASISGEMQLTLRLLSKTYDPFQKDMEWFAYELAVEGRRQADSPGAGAETGAAGYTARGQINHKDLNALLGGVEELTAGNGAMRFEPYDLNFYFEWSHETPLVYLIVIWFDLALSPRRFDQRFPSAHAGFRFLADHDALLGFRQALGDESRAAAVEPEQPKSSTLLQ